MVHAIDVLCVSKMRPPDGFRQRIVSQRRGDDVDVVRHQAVAQHLEAEPLGVFAKQFEVDTAIVVDEENILAVIPSLHDVVRLTGDDNSSDARHAAALRGSRQPVKKQVTVPI